MGYSVPWLLGNVIIWREIFEFYIKKDIEMLQCLSEIFNLLSEIHFSSSSVEVSKRTYPIESTLLCGRCK